MSAASCKCVRPPGLTPRPIVPGPKEHLPATRTAEIGLVVADYGERYHPRESHEQRRCVGCVTMGAANDSIDQRNRWNIPQEYDPECAAPPPVGTPSHGIRRHRGHLNFVCSPTAPARPHWIHRSKAKTSTKMVEVQAGLGLGIKEFRLVWVSRKQIEPDHSLR